MIELTVLEVVFAYTVFWGRVVLQEVEVGHPQIGRVHEEANTLDGVTEDLFNLEIRVGGKMYLTTCCQKGMADFAIEKNLLVEVTTIDP